MAGLDLARDYEGFGAMRAPLTRDGRQRPAEGVAELVASEVIPRLLVSCRANGAAPRIGATHIDTLARLSIARDPRAAHAHVGALREAGATIDALLNDLIGPAARRLGDFWSCDSADFAEVAIGSSRLVNIARDLGIEAERCAGPDAPRALIVSPETERHGLGKLILVQSFRAAGWRVAALPGAAEATMLEEARRDSYDFIGLSVGSNARDAEIGRLVAALRARSRNRAAPIAVGGPGFAADPDRALRIGADFTATDARDALSRVRALLSGTGAARH